MRQAKVTQGLTHMHVKQMALQKQLAQRWVRASLIFTVLVSQLMHNTADHVLH